MRLESCYFGQYGNPRWERMARVLSYTASLFCPSWSVNVTPIGPNGENQRIARKLTNNTHKLEHWADIVEASSDGERLLLIDTDTMILRSLDAVWDQPFDVAITTKVAEYPINGGVVFLRASQAVKTFMATWREVNRQMLNDPGFHQPWKRRFAGMNQAALGYILTEHRPALNIVELPCAEWNCQDDTWPLFAPEVTRIVHVKAALQLACLEAQPIPAELVELARLWKFYDREASQIARHA